MTTARTGLAAALFRKQPIYSPFNTHFAGLALHEHFNRGPMSMRPFELPTMRGRALQFPALALEEEARAPIAAPVSTAPKPAQTVAIEPKKSLWQTVTQRKVLIAAGVVLGVATLGAVGAAAYYFYPVATAAHAATVGNAGRAFAMNTQQMFIRPGFANTMFMAQIAMKAAVIPAAKLTLPVLLPIISTAIVTTLGTLVLLYVANRAWQAAKSAMWGAGTAVANTFSSELDKTYVGQAAKAVVVTAATPFIALASSEVTPGEPESEEESSAEDVTPPALQPRLQIEGPAKKDKAAATDEAEAVRIEKNRQGKKAVAAAQARKAQAKAQGTWMGSILRAGLVTAGLGAGIYFVAKAQPDLDFIKGQ